MAWFEGCLVHVDLKGVAPATTGPSPKYWVRHEIISSAGTFHVSLTMPHALGMEGAAKAAREKIALLGIAIRDAAEGR